MKSVLATPARWQWSKQDSMICLYWMCVNCSVHCIYIYKRTFQIPTLPTNFNNEYFCKRLYDWSGDTNNKDVQMSLNWMCSRTSVRMSSVRRSLSTSMISASLFFWDHSLRLLFQIRKMVNFKFISLSISPVSSISPFHISFYVRIMNYKSFVLVSMIARFVNICSVSLLSQQPNK